MKHLKLFKGIFLLSCFLFLQPSLSNTDESNIIHFIPNSMVLKEFTYPFQPVLLDIPDSVLKTISDSDILFIGEAHRASVVLQEKKYSKKYHDHHSNWQKESLNQENIYFNLLKKFSEIHATAKKCLWMEYDSSGPNLEKFLQGWDTDRSHYHLIHSARDQGWSIFAVDNTKPDISKDPFIVTQKAKLKEKGIERVALRDIFMANKIAKTISEGLCEKGIASNGKLHLSVYDLDEALMLKLIFSDYNKKIHYSSDDQLQLHLDGLLKTYLENIGLVKSMGFFILRFPNSPYEFHYFYGKMQSAW